MLKRYCAKCSVYSTFLTLSDGRVINLQFSGKDVLKKERFIDVDDELIQEALEKSTSFNEYYYLSDHWKFLQETEVPENEVVIKNGIEEISQNIPKEPVIEKPEIIVEVPAETIEEPVINLIPTEKSFEKVKDAKAWLNTELNVPFHMIGNKESIIEKALEFGYKVVFTN